MTKSIDFTKPVQTREGKSVRIITTTEGTSKYPVVGVIEGWDTPQSWTTEGRFVESSSVLEDEDLVNTPEVVISFANVYAPSRDVGRMGIPRPSLAECPDSARVAGRIKLTFMDGALTSVEQI